MNNFRVPPSPTWYTPPVTTPEHGLLYIAGNHTSIAYIPPAQKNDTTKANAGDAIENRPNIQIIQTHNHFKAIDCDPKWSTTKWFVTMNEQNLIWVWNLETEKICRGHKAHVLNGNDRHIDADTQLGGAMCITKNRQVLSMDRNAFVRYCLVSNTFSIFPDNFILKRGTVSLLKTSPYNQDVIAVGYKNGLILIANYAETVVLQKLRGHDSEVVSLQWTLIASSIKEETKTKVQSLPESQPKPVAPNVASSTAFAPSPAKSKFDKTTEKKQSRREAPKPIVDAGDMFDIHSYDYLEEEFGTITNRVSTRDDAAGDRKATTNENFNFVEACQTLRDQIQAGHQSDSDESDGYNGADCNQSAVNMTDIQNMMKTRSPIKDDSIVLSDESDDGPAEIDELSNLSTIGSSHNTTEIVELEDVIKELNINADTLKESDGTVYLASGAQESSVIIWNANSGAIAAKIQLKSEKGRTKIPKSNCTIVWIRPDEFVVNGPDGRLSTWKVFDEGNESLKFNTVSTEYPDTAVINICSNVEYKPATPIVWTFSTHLNIIGHRFNGESSEIIAKYSTLPIGMFTLRECVHDPNKIAIAGNNKRINILDLSTLKEDNVEIQSLTSKIQAKVLALAWHPVNENLLSFSTNEGRVGIFNISKTSSAPELMKNFNGKDVYSLSFNVDETSKKCILFATNHQKLMIFNENSTKQDDHNAMEFPVPVSCVTTNEQYIAIGFSNGMLKILTNDTAKKVVYEEVLSKKYLSELSWSPKNSKKLAVSSNDNSIFILEKDDESFKKTGELTGHQGGVSSVRWSSQSEHKLVSASFDHTVRVWDTQSMECIAWSEYENKMHCAAFLPSDENYVICSGQSETMHIFKIEHRLVANIGTFDNKKKKKSFNSDIQWGTVYQNEATKLRQQEKKKLRQLEKKAKDEVSTITENLNAVRLTPATVKLNHTTILHLTNKELNKEPLEHLQRLLQESALSNGTEGAKSELFHVKLFGSREDVEKLLDDELKNHKSSKTDSIGNLLIPQIKIELKANIIESIEEKRLTEQQVSLAPSISYEFWKNCSLAYATQCIEQGLILQAIPHLLATQQVNEAIEKLSDAHFYREAWCIAKISKESEDKIFETIVTKWIAHLEHLGNLEGAALISYLVGKREVSYEVLNKRKFKTPQIEEVLNALSPAATNKPE